ncbi:MAG: tyrosine-type recombinase/integrase, partial [Planctomycetota bacterium]
MKTYQTKYTDRHGKKKTCSEWYLTFNDRQGKRRRLKAYTQKAETVKLGIEIETVIANNGQLKTDADKKWFADLLPRIQSKLTEWNVVNSHNMTDHLTTPLSVHLKTFIESRKAKNCKQQHISKTESSISKVLVGCGFRLWSDIDGTTVETFLAKGRGDNGYGEGTYNAHLTAVKTFTRWLSDERGLTPDPLARAKPIKQTTCRKTRRALNKDELDRLLTATRNGERRGNMTAEARYLVIRIATECGLRYSEIKSLRVLSFNLDANPCTVHVEAADSKGKRADDLILNNATAAEIKTFL